MRQAVECVNCGSRTDVQFWITVGALIIAALALLMNFVQFREFLRGVRARAEFKVSLYQTSCDSDGVRRTNVDRCATRVGVGIKNIGRKAAGETLINVLVPRDLQHLRWCGPNGEEMNGEQQLIAPTDEMLKGADGTLYECKYLARSLPRVGTKPHHLGHFQFYVELSQPGEIRIPVRVKVQADEIPDDIEDYIADLEVRVKKVGSKP